MTAPVSITSADLRLAEVWARTDRIFGLLAPHAWLARPIALRHPFIFYVGHLPAFAWNHLGAGNRGRPRHHAEFDELFSRGIDPDVDDPTRCHAHPDVPDRWPALREVHAYRDRVRGALLDSCGGGAGPAADTLAMVVEHEMMHQETLLYMLHRLPVEDLVRPEWLPTPVLGMRWPSADPERVRVAAGIATLGARADATDFGWDNERPAAEVFVPVFRVEATPVTNAQFRMFVEDGGYRRAEFWRAEDWAWRKHAALVHPIAWERDGERWRCRALFDRLPLDAVALWPVHVSLAEARAYAR